MVKLSNKQHELQQDRRLNKLTQRANKDDRTVARLERRVAPGMDGGLRCLQGAANPPADPIQGLLLLNTHPHNNVYT